MFFFAKSNNLTQFLLLLTPSNMVICEKSKKKNHSPTAELLVLSFEAEVPGQPTPPDKEIKFDPVKVVPVLAGFPEFKRS